MMNVLWCAMMAVALIYSFFSGTAEATVTAMTNGALEAVELSISLSGAYMLYMGLMEVAREAGLVEKLARAAAPLMKRLFPGAGTAVAPITLNLAANFLGVGSAATPFGLAAMEELQKQNNDSARATNDMCMFLALNSAAIELLPTGVLALRAAAGSQDIYSVVLPTFVISVISFIAAAAVCRLMEGRGQ